MNTSDNRNTPHTVSFDFMKLNIEVMSEHMQNMEVNPHGYAFVFIKTGSMVFNVDFEPAPSSGPAGYILSPGQVFSFVEATPDIDATAVRIDATCIDREMTSTLQYMLIRQAAFDIGPEAARSLTEITNILAHCIDSPKDSLWQIASAHLAEAFAALLTDELHNWIKANYPPERFNALNAFTRLNSLLAEHLCVSRQPAYYASLMGMTPSHLNSLVKSATGINVSLYLRQRSVREVCRMLALTDDTVHDIALAFGYDDPAYFTRVFTKLKGMSPTQFRADVRAGQS